MDWVAVSIVFACAIGVGALTTWLIWPASPDTRRCGNCRWWQGDPKKHFPWECHGGPPAPSEKGWPIWPKTTRNDLCGRHVYRDPGDERRARWHDPRP